MEIGWVELGCKEIIRKARNKKGMNHGMRQGKDGN